MILDNELSTRGAALRDAPLDCVAEELHAPVQHLRLHGWRCVSRDRAEAVDTRVVGDWRHLDDRAAITRRNEWNRRWETINRCDARARDATDELACRLTARFDGEQCWCGKRELGCAHGCGDFDNRDDERSLRDARIVGLARSSRGIGLRDTFRVIGHHADAPYTDGW